MNIYVCIFTQTEIKVAAKDPHEALKIALEKAAESVKNFDGSSYAAFVSLRCDGPIVGFK
jgi:hypothetical protein